MDKAHSLKILHIYTSQSELLVILADTQGERAFLNMMRRLFLFREAPEARLFSSLDEI